MLNPKTFFSALIRNKISFFTGVPDSLLKYFCAYITDYTLDEDHIIGANEGSCIALAAGYYLATGKIALVYMQNSGLGNAINPLISLAAPEVYSIPMLLLIGWRGEPGVKDEPQHIKQGRIMLKLLDALEIQYQIIDKTTVDIDKPIEIACQAMKRNPCPFAFLVRKGTFEPYSLQRRSNASYGMTREQAIEVVLDELSAKDIIVSTTGKACRELYEYRDAVDQDHNYDFLTVGSMGHCSQIALGIALKTPDKKIYCLDGDGALLMHMGALAIIGTKKAPNFTHILINNGAHDSVGGQPTVGFDIDFTAIARACDYKLALAARTPEEIHTCLGMMKSSRQLSFLEICVNKRAKKELGRPDATPVENKTMFMEILST